MVVLKAGQMDDSTVVYSVVCWVVLTADNWVAKSAKHLTQNM